MSGEELRNQWVYIVRVWLERTGTGPPAVRGSVRDVAGGPSVFFASARDLADFIALRGAPGPDTEAEG